MSTAFEAFCRQGRALRSAGRLDEAVAAYDAALALRPAAVDVHFNRANALQALERHAQAVAAYERVLALAPQDAEAANNRGVSLEALGRHADALASYDAALALRPGYAGALGNRGNALAALGRLPEALAALDAALALRGADHAPTLFSRGRVLQRLGRHEEALASFDAALRMHPDAPEGLCDRGNALQALGRYEEALAAFDAAAALAPGHVVALANRGNVLQALGRHREALDSYSLALALSPGDPEILWNQGLTLLALGDYARGWPLYEYRWRLPGAALAPRVSDRPRWDGKEPLAGRTLLLHAEQGYGDAIQFVRHAREVAGRGATVVVACSSALKALFERAEGVSRVVVPGREPLPPYDLHAPLMSLSLALGTTLQDIPQPPYLSADPQRVASWHVRLPPQRPRVGLVWSGNPEFAAARLKACPPLLLARLAGMTGFSFVSLQCGAARTGVAELGPGVLDAAGELGDFADTAALIAALDLVIGIDTAVVHLAGALDRPVWILLPFAADWRWLVGRPDSPWYPSARLYRQETPGDWAGVIARVADDLAAWRSAGSRSSGPRAGRQISDLAQRHCE